MFPDEDDDTYIQLVEKTDLLVYPNPATDHIYIISNNPLQNIHISDIYGKLLVSKQLHTNSAKIDLNDILTGVYIVHAIDVSGHSVSKRVLVVR